MIIPSIIEIPQICHQLGIQNVVISPGSRSAHLTIAFARHPEIKKTVIPDERSAAYIALGIAQSSSKPVVLVCTSGTATINYYPAIAEAYYQNVPLVVFTADRPSRWIDKNDGQTIRQTDLYKNHIKQYFTFPEGSEPELVDESRKVVGDAIVQAYNFPQGPVQVNVPIDEPFYPEEKEKIVFKNIVIDRLQYSKVVKEELSTEDIQFLNGKKVAIIAGQSAGGLELINALKNLSIIKHIPVFADAISNVHSFKNGILMHDSFSPTFEQIGLPDVIISFGRSILSKRLKLALRNKSDLVHWHVAENDFPADTYLSLKKVFQHTAVGFFASIAKAKFETDENYLKDVLKLQEKAKSNIDSFLSAATFSEMKAFQLIWDALPENCTVHLANSMSVRYANILSNKKGRAIYANRGTSGIDGSNSTAVGHAIHNKGMHFLLTGDMSFFYDRNAFWHNHLPDNLKVIIFNNHGGGIFRLIDGPSKQPELEEYFETNQKLTARNTAKDFGMEYYFCDGQSGLENEITKFLTDTDKAAILEIETVNSINQKVFQQYKSTIRNEA